MSYRVALGLAAALALPQAAAAADLGPYYPDVPPPVVADVPECVGGPPGRQVDHVYRPPQTAYILASACRQGGGFDFLPFTRTDDLYVYYDGGSMYKTDIRVLQVPR